MDIVKDFYDSFSVVYNSGNDVVAIDMLYNFFNAIYPFQMAEDNESRLTEEAIAEQVAILYQSNIQILSVQMLFEYLLEPLKSKLFGLS